MVMERRLLARIPRRIIMRNRSQFFGIIMLTFLAALAYVVFGLLIVAVNTNYESFKKRTRQEDFHFITAKPLDVSAIGRKYGVELEERTSWDYEFDGTVLRFFDISSKINTPDIPEGTEPKRGEVALDANYLSAHGLSVGDEIQIKGETFRISGVVYLPDYIYAIKNDTDILPDPKHFGFGIMNREDMKRFVSAVPFHYYMVRGTPADLDAFKKDIDERYGMLVFQDRDENIRIITTELKMRNAEPMSFILSGVILVISSILLFIVLRRLISSMHAEIGTLYALGYGRRELVTTYLRFPLLIWVFGSIPGAIAGYVLADPYIRFYASFFSIPMTQKVFSLKDLGIGVLMPAAFMFVSGYLALRDLLKRSVVEIIRGESEEEFGKTFRMAFLDRFPFRTRLMLKQGLLHPSREFVVVLGVVFSTFLLFYAVTAISGFSGLIDRTYTDTFRYNHMYVLRGFQQLGTSGVIGTTGAGGEVRKRDTGTEPFNMMTFTLAKTKTRITIFGIQPNSRMIVLRDTSGKRIEPDGLVVARSLADKLELAEGDELNLVSVTSGRKVTLRVRKIADLYVGNSGYMSIDAFNKALGLPAGTYVGLFSKKALSLPESAVLMSVTKSDLIRAFEENSATINKMFQVMAFISFLLSLTIVYVLSSLTIAENRKPLALFKVLGYYDRELSSVFLGFNTISFFVGFALGIPVFNSFVRVLYRIMLKDYDFAIDMSVGLAEAATVLVFLGLAFALSKYLGRRRIFKISPAVILKEQME